MRHSDTHTIMPTYAIASTADDAGNTCANDYSVTAKNQVAMVTHGYS